MTSLKVTLVAGIDPAQTRPGGIRSYVLGLARYLASTGADVSLLGMGGPAHNEPFRFVAVTAESHAGSLAFHRGLRKTIRHHPVSEGVIHAQRPDDLFPFLAHIRRPPLVATVHGDPLPGIRDRHGWAASYVYLRWERKAVAQAARLLFVDRQSREAFSSRYPEQAAKFVDTVVGIDLDSFRPGVPGEARRAWGLDERPHVLFAGRFEREKNLELLARSLTLCETHPMLLLAGAGPSTATFPAHLNGVPHQFLGVVPHERMASLFSAVDATILPSTREAMPLACLESLACGTPVVATRVGRLPEIVKSGANGFLADGDPSSLARAIDEAIHGSNWMRERCRASVANFGWDRVGPSLMLVYREVLQ